MGNAVPFIMIGSLVLVYVLSYALNKKTPVPEECKDLFDDVACTSCNNFTCGHHGGEE
jgi:hypothetical protein